MDIAGLISYVRNHPGGVAAFVNADSGPEAAYVEFAVTDLGELVFDTPPDSRKAANVEADPRVAIVFGGPDGTTLQCQGEADKPTGADRERCAAAYLSTYHEYTLDPEVSLVVRVKPTWARYGAVTDDGYRTEDVTLPA